MSPYVRTVKTASGARAVQIVHSSHRGSRDIEHLGSAHDDVELELLKAAARQRLSAGQGELDLGLEVTEPARRGAGGGPLPITSSRMSHLLDARARLPGAGLRGRHRRGRCVPPAGAGPDHRARQQARLTAGPGGSRRRGGLLPDHHAAAARLRDGLVAARRYPPPARRTPGWAGPAW